MSAWKSFRTAIMLLVVMIVLTGLIYPLVIVGVGEGIFRSKAGGSLVYRNGRPVGSSLIGQKFAKKEYFHPRPSAVDYNASTSGASNLGPTNQVLIDDVAKQASAYPQEKADGSVPVDIVTSSGSGLDPDISIAAAKIQAPRIAQARGVSTGWIDALIDETTITRQLGFLGENRLNVLSLNIELDRRFPLNK
ncbi:MAG: potassium-transporting ATPase subunit KdpC [Chloroflexi bacterium]|nr:potassium-transporting ATPase subunit KdpC [Chloroflexota bacterium]